MVNAVASKCSAGQIAAIISTLCLNREARSFLAALRGPERAQVRDRGV